MKAFAYQRAHDVRYFAIKERTVPAPSVGDNDLLVKVKAFAVNPVDCKVRQTRSADVGAVVLGWDAAGVVEEVGSAVRDFAVGDEVYYAGDISRPGSYAEFQAVDYRLAARKPASLGFADAASLPLTMLTAYEALFEHGINYDGSTVLIIGGAGGVGSAAIQLLKTLTNATVIATASRPDSVAWAKAMGADHVIGRAVQDELARLGVPSLDVVFGTTHSGDYLPILPQILRPFGHFMVIDDPRPFEIGHLKQKAISVHWEYMFAKAMHGYAPETQGAILKKVAELVDAGTIAPTRSLTLPADENGLRAAHDLTEAGLAIGKTVFEW